MSDFGSKIINGGNDITDEKILALGNLVNTKNGSFYEIEKYFSYDLVNFISETGLSNQIYLISGTDIKYAYHIQYIIYCISYTAYNIAKR